MMDIDNCEGDFSTKPRTKLDQSPASEVGRSRTIDTLVILCVSLAYLAALLTMGGASTRGTEWPARLLAAGVAIHAYAMYHRAECGHARFKLSGLFLLPAAIWLVIDSLIHPGMAWKAREAATTATFASVSFWLLAHHTRDVVQRKIPLATIAISSAIVALFTLGAPGMLLARLAKRKPDISYSNHATGPFGTPGELTVLMLIGFFLCLAYVIRGKRNSITRYSAVYLAVMILIGIYDARTISGMYGLLAGMTIISLVHFHKLIYRILTLTVAVVIFRAIMEKGTHAFGIFRGRDDGVNLPEVALRIFKTSPFIGNGTASFPTRFETYRPMGWDLNPDSAGGIFHTVLAENGIIGFMCLFLPAFVLCFGALRVLGHMRNTKETRPSDAPDSLESKSQIEPALMAIVAVAAAVCTACALDYARANSAIVIALSMIAATSVRNIWPESPAVRLRPSSHILTRFVRVGCFAVPCVAMPLFTLPSLISAKSTRLARDLFEKLPPESTAASQKIRKEVKLHVLDACEKECEKALSFAPDNLDAHALIARIRIKRFRVNGDRDGLGAALDHANIAASTMSARPEMVIPLIELLRTHMRFKEATEVVDSLYAVAPNHPAVCLEYVRTHLPESAKHARLNAILNELIAVRPENAEARRLSRLIELAGE